MDLKMKPIITTTVFVTVCLGSISTSFGADIVPSSPSPPVVWEIGLVQVYSQSLDVGSAVVGDILPGPAKVSLTNINPLAYALDGATASVSETDRPSITAYANAYGNGFEGLAKADGEVTYYFYVNGPPDQVVTVGATVTGSASLSTAIAGPSGIVSSDTAIYVSFGSYSASNNGGVLDASTSFQVATDSWNQVSMGATAEVQASLGSGTAQAYVDPYFYIPTTDSGYDQYSILISYPVGNNVSSAVPEVPTWTMLLLGFTGLGLVCYRASRRIPTLAT